MGSVHEDLGELAPVEQTAELLDATPPPAAGQNDAKVWKQLLDLAYEMQRSIDAAYLSLESQRAATLKQHPPESPGAGAARHYLKGLTDAQLILGTPRVATTKFRKWTRDLAAAHDGEKGGGR